MEIDNPTVVAEIDKPKVVAEIDKPKVVAEIDNPTVVAEIATAFEAYEKALVANDVPAILGFFDSRSVRYGVADQQRGLEEQARWRLAQPPLPPGRTLRNTTIFAYADTAAVVTTEFTYDGSDVAGRQSQTWIRFPEGWRIVHAHVSEPR